MAEDDVPSDEMRWMAPQTDPIDAVSSGDPLDEDLLDVATIVHDLRATFLSTEPLRRRPELAAFTDTHLEAAADSGQPAPVADTAAAAGPAGRSSPAGGCDAGRRGRTRKVLGSLGGLTATLAGKVLVGTAAAAASVGTLNATGVVDVPVLPDQRQTANEQGDGEAGDDARGASDDPGANGAEGKDTASDSKEAAQAYTGAVQEWTDCVAEAAAGRGDAETRTTGGFAPRDDCGEKPEPADFGLSDPPSHAADAAGGNGEGGESPSSETPGATAPGATAPGATAPGNGSAPSGDGSSNGSTTTTDRDASDPASDTPAGTAPGRGGKSPDAPPGRPNKPGS